MTAPKAVLYFDEGMESIMEKFDSTKTDFLPVINKNTFVGLVSKKSILEAYREKLKQMTIE
jgi:CIC family chloride channel protein